MRLHPNTYVGGRSERQADVIQRNTSAIAVVLGELRSSMSDLMYIKTERYLDQGIAYYPHLDMKAMESQGQVVATKEAAEPHQADSTGTGVETPAPDIQPPVLRPHEHEHDHAHEGESEEEHEAHAHEGEGYTKTVIRDATDDFRGFIGYLERNVKPWRDPRLPHQHTEGTELLPWFRLQTLSDPHNVRSYLIGSWWLKAKGDTQVLEALAFVEEGIRNNPDAFQLHLMKGSILFKLNRREEAAAAYEKAVDLARRIRPPEGDDDPKAEELGWDRYKEQDARTAARMEVLLRKNLGQTDEALRKATEYGRTFAKDAILERQIQLLTGQSPEAPGESSPQAPGSD